MPKYHHDHVDRDLIAVSHVPGTLNHSGHRHSSPLVSAVCPVSALGGVACASGGRVDRSNDARYDALSVTLIRKNAWNYQDRMLLLWSNPLVPFLLSIAKSVRRSSKVEWILNEPETWRNSGINWVYTGISITLQYTCPAVSAPLAAGTHPLATEFPISQGEKEDTATRPYREFVGTLDWPVLGDRPNLEFATSSVASFGHNSGGVHLKAAKRVLRYLNGASGGDSSLVVTIWRSRVIHLRPPLTPEVHAPRLSHRVFHTPLAVNGDPIQHAQPMPPT